MLYGSLHPNGCGFPLRERLAPLQGDMCHSKGGVQLPNKAAAPFLKVSMGVRYLPTVAGGSLFFSRGLPVKRQGKAKISVKPPDSAHIVKAEQAACEVDSVTSDAADPAAEPAILERHRGVPVVVEWTSHPAPAVES